jgi:hypothetical protein
MWHLPLDEVAHRLARETACVHCSQRPPGSESLGPEVPRACQANCPLFAHLPRLIGIARQAGDRPGDVESAVIAGVCGACHLKPTAGEFCTEYQSRQCPLSRYSGDVVAGLQEILASRGDGTGAGARV